MVTTVRYFCSIGHTETGGLSPFLNKINPNINWERVFPPVDKKAPKIRDFAIPKGDSGGTTGGDLIKKMLNDLKDPKVTGEFNREDVILLIDDADCRFQSPVEFKLKMESLNNEINEALQRKVIFCWLLASQEVEAWFLSHWQASFEAWLHLKYRTNKELNTSRGLEASHKLKRYVQQIMIETGGQWGAFEAYGFPKKQKEDACTFKPSSQIERACDRLTAESSFEVRIKYSKKYDGPPMLQQIDPMEVAKHCRTFFAPTYHFLSQLS